MQFSHWPGLASVICLLLIQGGEVGQPCSSNMDQYLSRCPKDNWSIFLEGEWKLSIKNNNSGLYSAGPVCGCWSYDTSSDLHCHWISCVWNLIGNSIIYSFKMNKWMNLDNSINMNHLNSLQYLVVFLNGWYKSKDAKIKEEIGGRGKIWTGSWRMDRYREGEG